LQQLRAGQVAEQVHVHGFRQLTLILTRSKTVIAPQPRV